MLDLVPIIVAARNKFLGRGPVRFFGKTADAPNLKAEYRAQVNARLDIAVPRLGITLRGYIMKREKRSGRDNPCLSPVNSDAFAKDTKSNDLARSSFRRANQANCTFA